MSVVVTVFPIAGGVLARAGGDPARALAMMEEFAARPESIAVGLHAFVALNSLDWARLGLRGNPWQGGEEIAKDSASSYLVLKAGGVRALCEALGQRTVAELPGLIDRSAARTQWDLELRVDDPAVIQEAGELIGLLRAAAKAGTSVGWCVT